MKTELFENINLTAESSAGILDEVEYTGVIRKDRNVAKFVQTVVNRAKHYRNRILSDIGGGSKIFQMKNGLLRIQIYVAQKDLKVKKIMNMVKVLVKEAEDEIAGEDSKQ